jgi:hypothetical protein
VRSKRSRKKCSKITQWGRCSQRSTDPDTGLCSHHSQWLIRGGVCPPYYEEKVVRGLLEPTWDWMLESESHALLNGRFRGDGRRIDQWTVSDPLGIELP